MLRPPSPGAQLLPGRRDPGLAECGLALVRRIPEHPPQRRPTPHRLAGGRADPRAAEPPADLSQGAPVQANPRENLLDDAGLLGDDLVAGLPAPVLLGDVPVSERRVRQDADRAAAGGMALPAAAALEDLRPLVLGDHALDLQEQLLLGGAARRMVEEDDLDPAAVQLVDQEDLVGVPPGEAVGGEDVEPVQGAGGRLVPRPLQRWSDERAATVALVDEGHLRVQVQAVAADAVPQGVDLAGDGVVLGLVLGGDAGVDRRPDAGAVHGVSLRLRFARGRGSGPGDESRRRGPSRSAAARGARRRKRRRASRPPGATARSGARRRVGGPSTDAMSYELLPMSGAGASGLMAVRAAV